MPPEKSTIQEVPTLDKAAMLAAMELGVAEALRKHRDQGVSIITWDAESQQIVETPADQIPSWIDEIHPNTLTAHRRRPSLPRTVNQPTMYKIVPPKLLFESSRPGRYTAIIPPCDVPDRPIDALIPVEHQAGSRPRLPELAELDVVRHYTNLSQPEHVDRRELLPARVVHDEVQPQAE